MIGEVLQDKYRVDKKIGEGGFARVYRGTHTELMKTVAIKVLKSVDKRRASQFSREAQTMGQLTHPNIVTVFDCGVYKNTPYIIMEYIEGPTVWEMINDVAMSPAQICDIAVQTCAAMSYAHKLGVIHRDLSLNNILVIQDDAGNPQVKIVDFGLAKYTHGEIHTSSEIKMGTLHFVAPEVISGHPVDERVDIFAFGVGLYRMVNGCFPFEAEHPTAVMYLIQNKFSLEFSDDVPSDLKDVILRCLEKDPRARAQTFDALIPDLEAVGRQYERSNELVAYAPVPGAHPSSKRNPYLSRSMIKHRSGFFGRDSEIRKIYSRLDSPSADCVALVGERRIGKSSLLNHIYNRSSRREHMQHHSSSIFAYMDFQSNTRFDQEVFIKYLFSVFTQEIRAEDYAKREPSLEELTSVVKKLDSEGKRVVILMDEFEVITQNEKFDARFFSGLRSLANNYKIAYVTSSRAGLQTMCHDEQIADSPFFNIFANLPVGPFTHDDALELITVPSAREGVALERYANELLEMAGYFPLYLQIACCSAFEFLSSSAEPDWKRIRRDYMAEAEEHYRFVWDHFDDGARENLRKIASGKTVSRKYEFVNEDLERKGYLIERSGGLKIFSPTFERFVLSNRGRARAAKKGFLGNLLRREQR